MARRAAHAGTCTAEADPIEPGDLIVSDPRGGYSHLACAGVDDEPDTDGHWPRPHTQPRRRRR